MAGSALDPSQNNQGSQGIYGTGNRCWSETESDRCQLPDERLGRRLRSLLERLHDCMGGSIPYACQDWACVKAAYRSLSNQRVSEAGILAGHFEAVRLRAQAIAGTLLVLHDTTEFTFQRPSAKDFGLLSHPRLDTGKGAGRRKRNVTVRGLLMHNSMVLDLHGVPLGLSAVKFWSRKQFKGCNELKRRVNPTRIPIEHKESYRWLENVRASCRLLEQPQRCVHVADRESDIYELFCTVKEQGSHFVLRTCVDRMVAAGTAGSVRRAMQKPDGKGTHRLLLCDKDGKSVEVQLQVSCRKLTLLPPMGKQKHWPPLELTVIHAIEKGPADRGGREPVEWKLVCSLDISFLAQAVEKLQWYALRWKIEVFHKVLKGGCRAEESQLRTAERVVKFIAVLSIVGWRVF